MNPLLPPASFSHHFASLLIVLTFVFSSFLIFPPTQAGERVVLTSPAGKSIKAELIAFNPKEESIRYKRISDGRVFQSRIGIFDTRTRERLKTIKVPAAPLQLEVRSTEELVYDRIRNSWREPKPEGLEPGSNDYFRSIIELENRSTNEVTELEIDLAIVIGPKRGEGRIRQERQTYPIRRVKGAATVEIQTRLYPVRAEDEYEGSGREEIKGAAVRLRKADSGEVVFEWKAEQIRNHRIDWDRLAASGERKNQDT